MSNNNNNNDNDVIILKCEQVKSVKPSIISDYDKFFDFYLPRNLKSITVFLPYDMLNDSEKIREALTKVRPDAEITILLNLDLKEIIFCLE